MTLPRHIKGLIPVTCGNCGLERRYKVKKDLKGLGAQLEREGWRSHGEFAFCKKLRCRAEYERVSKEPAKVVKAADGFFARLVGRIRIWFGSKTGRW